MECFTKGYFTYLMVGLLALSVAGCLKVADDALVRNNELTSVRYSDTG